MLEADPGQPKRVIEQVEGENGRQAGQQDDLPAFPADCFVDRLEPLVALNPAGHPVTGQVAPDQEGAGCAQRRPDRNRDEALDRPEDDACSQSQDGPRKRQDASQNVESGEDHRAERAETGDPGHGITQNLLKIEKLRRRGQKDDGCDGQNGLEGRTRTSPLGL